MTSQLSRNVRSKVRRTRDGWLGVVLVGERELCLGPFASKREARKQAKGTAREFAASYTKTN